jgi:UDP-glucose 4-epimerase
MKNILVTGAAGYIGSHVCDVLLKAGYFVIAVDNFTNSKPEALNGKDVKLYYSDIADRKVMSRIFNENSIDAVVHLAGYKVAPESVKEPLKYYRNNVAGTVALLEIMQEYGVKKLVFSSSAAVYGNSGPGAVSEEYRGIPLNPYGRSKQMIEDILHDLYASENSWNIIILRYFNPVGGKKFADKAESLLEHIVEVAAGKKEKLTIYGADYLTYDGTCVRDYVHVIDLAEIHVLALEKLVYTPGIKVYNVGSGKGCSVFDLVKTFQQTVGINVPYVIAGRRPGDIAESYADIRKAACQLGFKPRRSLEEACRDAWVWHKGREASANPEQNIMDCSWKPGK